MKIRHSALLFLLSACSGSAEPAPAPEAVDAAAVRAAAAAAEFAPALLGELTRALADGGPVAAFDACGAAAPAIADRVAAAHGLAEIGRTALRVRNPANAADEFERAMFERWLAGTEPGDAYEVVARADGGHELRWMRPIRLQAMCVQCHGTPEQIAPATRAALAERYPDDAATGFAPGDLRGAISVRVPLP